MSSSTTSGTCTTSPPHAAHCRPSRSSPGQRPHARPGRERREETTIAAGLAPRVANAVWDAFFGRVVTTRYYRPLADVSPATATNDLAAAVASGLLAPSGRARSRTYHAGDALYLRTGNALGVPVSGHGEPARAVIIGELTRRALAQGQGRA